MKRIMGLLMAICVLATSFSVHATNSKKTELCSSTMAGENYEEYTQLGDTSFFYSENEKGTKCISYNQKDNLLDYVEYVAGSDKYSRTVYTPVRRTSISNVREFLSTLNQGTVEKEVKLYDAKDLIYQRKVQKSFEGDSEKIMKSLYRSGYPKAYNNENARPVVVSGTFVMIKDSLSYSITLKSAYTAIAKTALSVISAVLSTPINTLIGILSIVSCVDGIYQLKETFQFNTYKVTANYFRGGFINNIQYSKVWKTVVLKAVVGDRDATTKVTDSSCDSNYENDRKIADIAYANYQVGYHY